jgi:hypothetical protein
MSHIGMVAEQWRGVPTGTWLKVGFFGGTASWIRRSTSMTCVKDSGLAVSSSDATFAIESMAKR